MAPRSRKTKTVVGTGVRAVLLNATSTARSFSISRPTSTIFDAVAFPYRVKFVVRTRNHVSPRPGRRGPVGAPARMDATRAPARADWRVPPILRARRGPMGVAGYRG